jgi:hypothetical protein
MPGAPARQLMPSPTSAGVFGMTLTILWPPVISAMVFIFTPAAMDTTARS